MLLTLIKISHLLLCISELASSHYKCWAIELALSAILALVGQQDLVLESRLLASRHHSYTLFWGFPLELLAVNMELILLEDFVRTVVRSCWLYEFSWYFQKD